MVPSTFQAKTFSCVLFMRSCSKDIGGDIYSSQEINLFTFEAKSNSNSSSGGGGGGGGSGADVHSKI